SAMAWWPTSTPAWVSRPRTGKARSGGVRWAHPRTTRPRSSSRNRGLLREPDAARLAHLGLDAVLGLELLEEFLRREGGGQDVHLALDRREVAGAQLVELRQARADVGREQRGVCGQRLGDEHLLPLRPRERLEPDLEGEAPQRRLVDA